MPDQYTKVLLKYDKGFLNIANVTPTTPQIYGGGTIYCDEYGPFVGNSYYFSGSELVYPHINEYNIDTDDFAVDFYIKILQFPTSEQSILRKMSSPASGFAVVFHPTQGIGFRFCYDNSEFAIMQGSVAGWSAGVWYHVAITRAAEEGSRRFRIFRDGVEIKNEFRAQPITSNTLSLRIGGWTNGVHQIANIRISVGTPRWTSNFSKPISYHVPDPYTKFLCTFEMDVTKRHNFLVYETPSTHEINTKKWGRASWLCRRTGIYSRGLTTLHNNIEDFAFGSGDFTIDFQLNFSPNTQTIKIMDIAYLSHAFNISVNANRYIVVTIGANSYISTTQIIYGQWYHIAVTRHSGTLKIFIDGIVRGSFTNTTNLQLSGTAYVDLPPHNDSNFTFYVDEFRISKGIARWTSNFTPPTNEYGDYKLSGVVDRPCTITVFDNNTKKVETEKTFQVGDWVISPLTYTEKIVMAKAEDGETICYGNVFPVAE